VEDVREECHGLLGPNLHDRPGFYPLCELIYGDEQVRIAPGRSLEGPTKSSPQTVNDHVIGIIWSA
jgi:hypothetical protein